LKPALDTVPLDPPPPVWLVPGSWMAGVAAGTAVFFLSRSAFAGAAGWSIFAGVLFGLAAYATARFLTLLVRQDWRRKTFAKFQSLSPQQRRSQIVGLILSTVVYAGLMALGRWWNGEGNAAWIAATAAIPWLLFAGWQLLATGTFWRIALPKEQSDGKQGL
jgi:hypothetical protein